MKFIVSHPLPRGITREDLEKLQESVQQDPNIKGYRSFLNLTEGKGVCIIEAPDKKALTNWLAKNKMTADSIIELELESFRGEPVEVETPVGTGV